MPRLKRKEKKTWKEKNSQDDGNRRCDAMTPTRTFSDEFVKESKLINFRLCT